MKPEVIEIITNATNRSVNQTKALLSLIDNDIDTLLEIEDRIINLHLSYCPGTKEDCQKILDMKLPDKCWWEKPIIIIYESKTEIKWPRKQLNLIQSFTKNWLNTLKKTKKYRLYYK